jgi:predicted dehydrogenase
MKQFRIIMAGCGDIAYRWLDHITKRDDCEIIAIAEKNPARAENYCQRYNLTPRPKIYNSVEEALANEQGNLLIDLTYVTVHHDIVTTALKAGYDVLGEKPMAFTVDQVNDMLKTVDETGKRYFVMQNRRYIEQVKKIRQLVLSGIMGAPSYICGEIFVCADMASIRNQFKYPQLQDNNIHSFDLARFLVDGKPKSVHYHSFNPKGSMYTGDGAGDAVFEFDNGAIYSFRGYNGAEGCYTSWDNVWRINCELGSVVWDGQGDAYYEYCDNRGDIFKGIPYKSGVIKRPDTVRDQHDGALEDMFDALKTGRTPLLDCKDNVNSIAMVLASVKSIEENRKVGIEVSDKYPYLTLV